MNIAKDDLVYIPEQTSYGPLAQGYGFVESIKQNGSIYYPTCYTIQLMTGHKLKLTANDLAAGVLEIKAKASTENHQNKAKK